MHSCFCLPPSVPCSEFHRAVVLSLSLLLWRYMDLPQFVPLPVDGYMKSLQFRANMSITAVNIHVQAASGHMLPFLSSEYLEVGLTVLYGRCMFNCMWHRQIVFQSGCTMFMFLPAKLIFFKLYSFLNSTWSFQTPCSMFFELLQSKSAQKV